MWIPQWSQFDGDDPTFGLSKTKFRIDIDQIKMSLVIDVECKWWGFSYMQAVSVKTPIGLCTIDQRTFIDSNPTKGVIHKVVGCANRRSYFTDSQIRKTVTIEVVVCSHRLTNGPVT